MKLSITIIGAMTAIVIQPAAARFCNTLEYSHSLMRSFVGTNQISYQLLKDGQELCSESISTTGFADNKYEPDLAKCPGLSKFIVNIDGGGNNRGYVDVGYESTIGGVVGSVGGFTITLEADGPDQQFGCGDSGICVGVAEKRKGSLICLP